jgi:hypothetical protein
MRLIRVSDASRVGGRVRHVLQRRRGPVERRYEAAARTIDFAGEAAQARERASGLGRRDRQTAVAIAVVAASVVVIGAAAYIWWHRRQEERQARLHEPDPQHPGLVPASSPDNEPPEASGREPEPPGNGHAARAADAVREPAAVSRASERAAAPSEGATVTPSEAAVPNEPVASGRAEQSNRNLGLGAAAAHGTQPRRGAASDDDGNPLPNLPRFATPGARIELPSLRSIPPLPRKPTRQRR